MALIHNYNSPDGFTIRFDWFSTKEDADLFLKDWIKGFRKQGFYSTYRNGYREEIPVYEIESNCTYINLEEDIEEIDTHCDEPF